MISQYPDGYWPNRRHHLLAGFAILSFLHRSRLWPSQRTLCLYTSTERLSLLLFIVRGNVLRRGSAQMGFSERIDTILIITEPCTRRLIVRIIFARFPSTCFVTHAPGKYARNASRSWTRGTAASLLCSRGTLTLSCTGSLSE